MFWIIQLVHMARPNFEVNHITVLALIINQKADAVLLQLAYAANEGQALGAGRKFVDGGHVSLHFL